jgi:hypothetical protein
MLLFRQRVDTVVRRQVVVKESNGAGAQNLSVVADVSMGGATARRHL